MEQNISLNKNRHMFGRRNIAGAFIAAHGAMHAILLSLPRMAGGAGNYLTNGGDIPVLSSIGLDASGVELLGAVLVLTVAAGLLVGALLYLRGRGTAWEFVLSASAVLSIVTLLIFWNEWMVMGPIIDLGILALVYRSRRASGEA
jgi:hypothetical protein